MDLTNRTTCHVGQCKPSSPSTIEILDVGHIVYLLTEYIFLFQNPGFDFSSAKLDKRYEDKCIRDMAKATDQELRL